MLWWSWTGKQRLLLVAAMFGIASLPWLLVDWLPHQPGAFVGGVAFLMIPQLVGWNLFVGLKTGRIPTRNASESRADSPLDFWRVAATYILLLIASFGILVLTLSDIAVHGRF